MKRAKSPPSSTATAKPAAPPAKSPAPPVNQRPNPRLQANTRWQRTQRYGWDKGGSRGGR